VVLIAEVPQLEVGQALVEVRQALCGDPVEGEGGKRWRRGYHVQWKVKGGREGGREHPDSGSGSTATHLRTAISCTVMARLSLVPM